MHNVHYTSDSAEWYTPPKYIEAARRVMGGIDLDPASCYDAQQVIQAARYYTKAENGLLQPWVGRVWLNPPYGDQVAAWVQRLVTDYELGRIEQAVLLVAARPDTRWFAPLFDYPICFVSGRIRFGNAPNSAPFPSACVYIGEHVDRFYAEFRQFGRIVQAVHTKPRVMQPTL